MGCGYVITVLDSCNRPGESGVRLAGGALNHQQQCSAAQEYRESAIVGDHVVVA